MCDSRRYKRTSRRRNKQSHCAIRHAARQLRTSRVRSTADAWHISRADQPDPVVRVDPPLLSDHSLVVASFDATREQSVHPSSISRRCWRSFDFGSFIADLKQSQLVLDPPPDVTELFQRYDTTQCYLTGQTCTVAAGQVYRARRGAPWYDAECHAAHNRRPPRS